MTYYDHLDCILHALYLHKDKETFETQKEIFDRTPLSLTYGQFLIMFESLSNYGFIFWDSIGCKNDHHKISLKGIEFFEDGGFKAKKDRLIRTKCLSYITSIGIFLSGLGILIFTAVQAYTGWLSVNRQDTTQGQQITISQQSELKQQNLDIQNLYDALINVQMDRDSLERRLLKLESK